ncbi:hypothetical protein ACQCN2_00705 [Brevibacillus ginsengisoli]|uniref:hypothetical protein n=1 Tax=Brevibacillus ginsengisoli TaxID=363854 RepID=UPI003CEEEDB5
MRSKHKIIYSCLVLSILVMSACTNQTTKSENSIIESRSSNLEYQGKVKPIVERKIKITNEQQKTFDSLMQSGQLQKQGTGGEKDATKPHI